MAARKRIILIALILAACVGCDQRTKYLAGEHLRGKETVSFLAGAIRLDYAENTGGFLGLGDSLPQPWRSAVFSTGCSALIAAVLYGALATVRSGALQVLGLGLISAGGIGNLIDRWAYGYSRDFLNVGLGPVCTGIFNVADVALMAGCLLILWSQRRTSALR